MCLLKKLCNKYIRSIFLFVFTVAERLLTMNVVIIEEKKTAEKLSSLIIRIDPNIKIAAKLETVKESIAFFQENNKPIDLAFSDVDLKDGSSFSIFKTIDIRVPVVYITAFDEFVQSVLEHNGIDYIPKPIREEDVKRSLVKYKKLQKHFISNNTINKFIDYFNQNKRTRLIVKWGTDNIALPLNDIALFYTKNKVVYAIDKTGKRYIIDKSMTELENELDSKVFFRVNRQYIVSIHYIKGFSTYERVKLELEITIPDFNDIIIISQDTAPVFKTWISEA